MRTTMPKGFREKGHPPKVAVMFPEELFEKIKAQATKEGKPFSAMVCELCAIGLFDLEESDSLEPENVFQGASQ